MKNMPRKPQVGITSALLGMGVLLSVHGQVQQGGPGAGKGEVYWNVDALRGPVDLGLTDPALVGALDVHAHLDPDAPEDPPGFGLGKHGVYDPQARVAWL